MGGGKLALLTNGGSVQLEFGGEDEETKRHKDRSGK